MHRFAKVDNKPIRLPHVYGYRTHPLLPLREALDPILSRINDLDHHIEIAKNKCHYPSEHGLTREESASIYIYTMDWGKESLYRILNEVLSEKDRSVLVPWHGYLKLFHTALNKLPSRQMNLWRGTNGDISKNYKEGDELTWWYFSSCSSSLKEVKKFLDPVSTLMMIEAKSGKDISLYSNFPNENEVIFCLGSRLRVVDDAMSHPSLNVIHLIELIYNDEKEVSSPISNMSIIQTKAINTGDSDASFKIHTYANGDRYDTKIQK